MRPLRMAPRLKAVLFDVDGTLVDSNDAHAHAWVRAFAEHGITVDFDAGRRCIGMGGDKLMPAVAGIEGESPQGESIAGRRGEIFRQHFVPALKPFRDAARLVAIVKERGFTAVAASSARKDELKPLLAIASADSLMDAATSSDDAEESKPEPDIINAALKRAAVSPAAAIMIGDTPYDVMACRGANVAIIGVTTGGWSTEALSSSIAVYAGAADLLARWSDSPLA